MLSAIVVKLAAVATVATVAAVAAIVTTRHATTFILDRDTVSTAVPLRVVLVHHDFILFGM